MPDVSPRKLSDLELRVIIEAELEAAMGYMDSELSEERSQAMDRYLGEPLGTEMEGRSQVQTRDVMETIEWIMPTLIRIFTNKDRAVEFTPVGPEDEQQAEQETDYLNYIFYKKNNGFLILYSWFKDALLQKNGIIKSYAEEKEEVTKETYNNLMDVQLQVLMSDDDYEIEEMESRVEEVQMADTGETVEVTVYDVVVSKTEKEIEFCSEVIPPEEFVISNDANSVDPEKARFCAHKTTKTISELREMGFTDDQIGDMDIGESEVELSEERLSRLNLAGEERYDTESINTAMRRVKWVEAYIRVDADGDGKAELRKVFYSGRFIEHEEIDYHPFDTLTPIILTHKFYGLSIADLVRDIQEVRTNLFRAYFDNINQLINGRTFYDENTVNLDDMLTSKPFGLVAVDGMPGQAVLIDRPSGLPPEAFTLNEMLDKFLHNRVGDFQTQLDPNVLAQANTGVVINMLNEAKSKVEMIARIFGEVGVKSLFRTLHHLVRKHEDRETRFQLKNNWVPVNPSEWKERKNLTVNVGLGTQNHAEQLANIKEILQTQMGMLQMGVPVVTPENIFQTATELSELMGFVPQKFWTPPQMIPPRPPQPDAQMELVKVTAQAEEAKARLKQAEIELNGQIKAKELELKVAELQSRARTEQDKTELAAMKEQLTGVKGQSDTQLKAMELRLKERELALKEDSEMAKSAMEAAKLEVQSKMDEYKTDMNAMIELIKDQSKQQQLSDQQERQLINELFTQVQDLGKPQKKSVQYDENGRISAVGNQKVKRDENGRVIEIE